MRNTSRISDRLLISSPNGGGLALLEGELCLPVMRVDITGLALGPSHAVWCLQADGGRTLRELRDGQSRTISLSKAPLDLHDVLLDGDDVYVACTEPNEVVRYDRNYKVRDRWSLPGESDSVHLNSIALYKGRLVASIFGRFTGHREYKGRSQGAGEIIDVRSGETLLAGLSQPHSLVAAGNKLYLCSSEDKELLVCEDFRVQRRVSLPGYARGLAIGAKNVYVGLSRSRNLEIDSDAGSYESAVVAVLSRGSLRMLAAVPMPWAEIYDIRILNDAHLATELVALGWTDERAQATGNAKALQAARQEAAGVAKVLAERDEAVTRLRTQVQEQGERLKTLNQAQATMSARAKEQEHMLALEKQKLQGAHEQLSMLSDVNKSRDKELSQLRQTWRETQEESLRVMAEREVLRQALAEAKTALAVQQSESQNESSQAKAECDALRQALAEAKTALAAQQSESQNESSQAKAECDALRSSLAKANAALVAEQDKSQQALESGAAELEQLRERLARRDTQVVRLRSSHAELAKLAITRQRELEKVMAELDSAREALAEQRASADHAADVYLQVTSERDARITTLEGELAQQDRRMQDAIEDRDARLAKLQGELAQQDRRMQDAIEDRDARIGTLEREIVLRDERIGDLFANVAQRDGRIDELVTRAESLGREKAALDSQVRDLKIRVSILEPRAEELELVKLSRSWRVTRPLRFLMRLVRHRGLVESDRERIAAMWPRGSKLVKPVPTLSVDSSRVSLLPLPSQPGFEQVAALSAASASMPTRSKQSAVAPPLSRPSRPKARDASEVSLAQQAEGLEDVYIWSVIDWHFRTQRPQHLARELAETGRRVFYVSNNFIDSPDTGFRVEPLDDSGRLFQVFLKVRGKPAIYFDLPGDEARRQIRASFATLLDWTHSRRSLALVQHPFWSDVARAVPNHRLIYDCMDHHGGFENNGSRILEEEEVLMRAADLLVVSSSWLDEEGAKFNRSRALIRNAGEYAHFCERPSLVFSGPCGRRVIGYYGAIAQWFDLELVEKVASAHKDCLVLLVGADTCKARERLTHCPNVEFTGEVSYASLPYYLHGFDVCMLPFQVLPLTVATNPVKAYEYLSAGKPLVTVDLPEMRQFDGLVDIAGDHDKFVELVGKALAEPVDSEVRERRREFASGQTWSHRVQALLQAVDAISEPKVSVVVLTYNNLELTKACLSSLEQHSDYPALELIVVDNGSSDGTPAFLRDWVEQGRERKLILNDENRGFAAGNNQGLAAATGEFLVLLNNDTEVTPGWVRTMSVHLRKDSDIGIIGPVTNNIGNEARIETRYVGTSEMLEEASAYTRRHPGDSFAIRTVAFFCVMFPRAVYERIGPLDEAFGAGFFEDDDYCRRIEAAGLRVMCAEDVFIHHHLSASFKKLDAGKRKELFERNKAIYEAKWGPWAAHRYREKAKA